MRSKEGEGRQVEIYYLCEPFWIGDPEEESQTVDGLMFHGTIGEDYAKTDARIAVKIALGFPRALQAAWLRRLADNLENGPPAMTEAEWLQSLEPSKQMPF